MMRIGLFGGTFDPVHYGHLRSALELAEHYSLDTLYLVPNHRPQHRDTPQATTEQRIHMLELAVKDVPRLVVDVREAKRDSSTYTIDTLLEVKAEQPDATILFFMGFDAFAAFDQWHRWEEILKQANLVVIDRPDAELSDFAHDLIARQTAQAGSEITAGSVGVIERRQVTQLAISATDVRRRVTASQNVRFLLPDSVREYILNQRLYH